VTSEKAGDAIGGGRKNTASEWISFGPYVLWPGKHVLKREGDTVRLGGRALDILIALLDRPGEILSKSELALAVWGRDWVEDAALRMAIVALRKALDDQEGRYIENVSGEGYRFSLSGDIALWPPRPDIGMHLPALMESGIPPLATRLIGRAADMASVLDLLERSRLVSVVGVGGVGKTALSLAVSAAVSGRMPVHFADLSRLRNPDLVPWQIALALGVEKSVRDVAAWLFEFRTTEPFLLVLDNCEHAAAIVAKTVERLLANNPRARILATSREPLRARGETLYRLKGLGVPEAGQAMEGAAIETNPALHLLFDRLLAARPDLEPSDIAIDQAAIICRRLDGLPLAIELAASRIASLGMAAVYNGLNDRFDLLNNGPRSAPARNQALAATFDWSYRLLAPEEQAMFRRLGIFYGRFSLAMVASLTGASETECAALLGNLVDKSMVVSHDGERERRFSLLESMRLFADELAREAGEYDAIARRHAEMVLAFWRQHMNGGRTGPDLRRDLGPEEVCDLLAAMRWALLSKDDFALARELLAVSLPAADLLGLSLAVVEPLGFALAMEPSPIARLALLVTFASVISLSDWSDDFQRALFAEAVELAEQLGCRDQALQSLWGLGVTEITYHKPRGALQAGRRLSELARAKDRDADRRMGDLLQAYALNVLGRHVEAEPLCRLALADFPEAERAGLMQRYYFDGIVVGLGVLASAECGLGRAEDAVLTAERAIEEAEALGHIPSLFSALTQPACPLALDRGDQVRADRYLARLREVCKGAPGWQLWLDGFEAVRRVNEEATEESCGRLNDFVQKHFLVRSNQYCGWFKLQLTAALLSVGHVGRARALTAYLRTELEQSGEEWLLPALLGLEERMADGTCRQAEALEVPTPAN